MSDYLPPEVRRRLERLVAGTAAGEAALGRFVLLEELGRGGMGIVYRAYDPRLRREVALKVLRGEADARAAERFEREAVAMARVRHPGVVPIHEAGVADGRCFLALELVPGTSLARALPSLDPERRLAILADVARAVSALHENGIVHRDLKPANILLDEQGRPRVTDFGVAKDLAGAAGGDTQAGEVLGTPWYMAPEQLAGPPESIGPATDVWALGVILYELLVGERPFAGESWEALRHRILAEEPAAPRQRAPSVPRDLESVCLRALEKDPRRRYACAGELADELERFRAGRPVRARPVGALARAGRRLLRSRVPGAVLLFAVAGAIAGVLALWALAQDLGRARRSLAIADAHEAMLLHPEVQAALREAEAADAEGGALAPERFAALRARVERVCSALEASHPRCAGPRAVQGWFLALAHRDEDAEAVLVAARTLSKVTGDDPYGLLYHARWWLRRCVARTRPAPFLLAGRPAVFAVAPADTPELHQAFAVAALDLERAAESGTLRRLRGGEPWLTVVQAGALLDRGWFGEAAADLETLGEDPALGAEGLQLAGLAWHLAERPGPAARVWGRLADRPGAPVWIVVWAGLARLAEAAQAGAAGTADRAAYERAIVLFEAALARHPGAAGAAANRGVARLKLGELEAAAGRDARAHYEQARADLSAALERFADFWPVYADRGLVLERLGRRAEAARDYRRALELAPSAPEVAGRLAGGTPPAGSQR